MSDGARTFLGASLVLIALGFFATGKYMYPMMPGAGMAMGVFGLFSAVGAVACFSASSRPVTIRVVGGMVFVACLWYLGVAARNPTAQAHAGVRRDGPVIVYALLCFVVIGLPAGYAALTGRYPGWGRHAGAFGAGKESGPSRSRPPANPRRF